MVRVNRASSWQSVACSKSARPRSAYLLDRFNHDEDSPLCVAVCKTRTRNAIHEVLVRQEVQDGPAPPEPQPRHARTPQRPQAEGPLCDRYLDG